MHNARYFTLFVLGVILSCFFISCGEETSLGADIINEEDLNVEYAEDFDLVTKVNQIDSLVTYTQTDLSKRTFLLGKLDDPIFGKSSASIITQVYRSGEAPDFERDDVLDSMVFSLKLDTIGLYGNTSESVDIEIRRVLDDFAIGETYYSNSEVMTSNSIIASGRRKFRFDSISVYLPPLDSNVVSAPQIRLPLDMALANQIFDNPTLTESDSIFTDFLKGISINVVSESNAMGAIDMGSSRGFSPDNESLLQVFYTRDTSKFIYNFVLGGVRFNQFDQDYSSATVSEYLSETTAEQDLMFLQTRSGLQTDLDISNLTSLGDVLLNNVEIEMTIATMPEDNLSVFPPLENLIAYQTNADGDRLFLSDLAVANTGNSLQLEAVEAAFGGVLLTEELSGVSLNRYRMNVTKFAQDYLNGENNGIITIASFFENDRPGRSVIQGPGSNSHPAKLKVTYTIK